MSTKLKVYDLAPSPNNMKVRIALNYKEIPFEKVAVSGDDRAEVIKVSGQPLTPVLVDGDKVLFDSSAILRYLDANFRSTRPLFSSDYNTMHEIEDWEMLGRAALVMSVGMIFGQFFSPEKDPAVSAKASSMLHENSARLEERLSKANWLVGDGMTAADVSCAPMAYYGMLTPEIASISPLHKFFYDSLKLGEGRDKTRAWVGRVMAYDR